MIKFLDLQIFSAIFFIFFSSIAITFYSFSFKNAPTKSYFSLVIQHLFQNVCINKQRNVFYLYKVLKRNIIVIGDVYE